MPGSKPWPKMPQRDPNSPIRHTDPECLSADFWWFCAIRCCVVCNPPVDPNDYDFVVK